MAGDVGHLAEVAEPGISFERRQNYHETMIPSFPAGATIGAIHAACVHMGRFVSVPKSIPVIYGIRTDPANRFGLLADAFAKNALDGTVTGSELIGRHTALPIFASLLTPESRALWTEAQLAGDTNAWMRYFPPNTSGDLFAETPRMCPSCLDEDVARFGVPYWRVQHQLSWVASCHEHAQALHDRCAECGAPFPSGLKVRVPGAPCVACKSTRTRPLEGATPSAGRTALEELLARAFDSQAPELAPDVRIQLFREAFAGKDSAAISKRFMAFWKAKGMSGLERTLGCAIPQKGLTRLIVSGAGQVPVAVLLSLVTFATSEVGPTGVARAIDMARQQEARLIQVDADARHSDILSEALTAQARALSMPPEVVDMLLRDDLAGAYILVGGLNVACMVDRLPAQHRSAFSFAFRARA